MSLHPVGDKLKVKIADKGFLGSATASNRESGVVVEVPDKLLYFGFHSFAFESSLGNEQAAADILEFYKSLEGKVVYWEALQDRGRRFEEDDVEYVLLNMTDILAYDDEDTASAKIINDTRSGGFSV